jgi:hypothetical protein
MKANQGVERVFELLEQFDFNELCEQDKIYVLSVITEKEYNNMRGTINDVGSFFTNSVDVNINSSIYKSLINKNKHVNILIKLLKRPIQIYKVAASAIVLIGLYSFFHLTNLKEKTSPITSNDTIFMYNTDTVYSKFVDTVRLIKQKIVFISREQDLLPSDKLLSNVEYEYDQNKEICPGDIDIIIELGFNNSVSNDTILEIKRF